MWPLFALQPSFLFAMLFLLSPAKSLDYDTPAAELPHTLPQFIPQPLALIEVLREAPQQISSS
jgi:cytoplasmic iron level regulating protein YaaA (DUF328/UPF0246 family)